MLSQNANTNPRNGQRAGSTSSNLDLVYLELGLEGVTGGVSYGAKLSVPLSVELSNDFFELDRDIFAVFRNGCNNKFVKEL